MYYLGIDGGGTKCRARLTDKNGTVLAEGLAGSANMGAGADKVFRAIKNAYAQCITSANLGSHDVGKISAGLGIAGISRKGAKKALQACPFPFAVTHIETDGHIANLGAHAGADGGIVIVGTGSVAIGRVAGKHIQIGGYGFPISDEGSGAYIGLQAIRKTLRASDGRIHHSPLTQNILLMFKGHIPAIIGWMDKARAPDYAKLAPKVIHAAETGDEHGREIIQHATHHVELMIRGLYQAQI
ncbi:MAG TPA: N-acetylglucosamine kinase, partial [Hellea balneolensis]|nr:N-acetylglucosamine kinase [Hellea balneolensis]